MSIEAPTKKSQADSEPLRTPQVPGVLRFYPLGDPAAMRFVPLLGQSSTLGRGSECTVIVVDDEVSREHATIERDGAAWLIRDKHSSNGLFVAGQRVAEARLQGGELIRIGSTLLLFLAPGHGLASVACDLPISAPTTLVGGPRFEPIRRLIHRFSKSNLSILLSGETGTGKEVVARYLHQVGSRSRGPFVAVNCAAIPQQIFESQLFGHLKGAFTDARSDALGLVRSANGGVLFLDEIGELPLGAQAKLLRFLQDSRVLPVGAHQPVAVDVRVVCATNRDLLSKVREETFREDLYARICGLELSLPPLRERVEDIPLLVRHLLDKHGRAATAIAARALELLCARSWPHNIRQLETAIQRALVLADQATTLLPEHFDPAPSTSDTPPPDHRDDEGVERPTTPQAPVDAEAQRLHQALLLHRGNAKLAARELGISRSQFYRWIKRFDIDVAAYRRPRP